MTKSNAASLLLYSLLYGIELEGKLRTKCQVSCPVWCCASHITYTCCIHCIIIQFIIEWTWVERVLQIVVVLCCACTLCTHVRSIINRIIVVGICPVASSLKWAAKQDLATFSCIVLHFPATTGLAKLKLLMNYWNYGRLLSAILKNC